MFLHVNKARHLEDYKLWLQFNDGVEGEIDLEEFLVGVMFEPLRKKELFENFRVDPEINTIVWANGADFAPEFLQEHLSVLR